MSAITRGTTARAAILVHAGSRRAFSLGVTRPRTTGVCSRTSSDSKAVARSYPSSSRRVGCSSVVPVSWKMHARSYATEGSAPPADKVRHTASFNDSRLDTIIAVLIYCYSFISSATCFSIRIEGSHSISHTSL